LGNSVKLKEENEEVDNFAFGSFVLVGEAVVRL
jgi:hypothetical protein